MSSAPPGNYISKIVVEQLYGEFSYEIGPVKDSADPRVIILYGSNGTGKSTILQLLRSLLSPSNSSGHRSRIAQIPFKKFEVNFTNGGKISATRERDLSGPYLLTIAGGGQGLVRVFIKTEADGSVQTAKWSRGEQEQFQNFLEALTNISREVAFLDDKRTFSKIDYGERARLRARRNVITHEGYWIERHEDELEDPVVSSVNSLVDSVRREALLRQSRGSGDSQSIYKGLISTLAHGKASIGPSVDDLVSRLRDAEMLSQELSAIGLITPIHNRDIVDQLMRVSDDRRVVVTDLVSAYVKSTEAWFGALKELKLLLDVFVERLSYFMPQKVVLFTVSDGLRIVSGNGRPLLISSLSSGERQLVMMLTQALLGRNEAALMVIDEPELSLNMKWQRELVAAILECLGGGSSQVIFATHSIEIAARYRKNVVRLWARGEQQNEKDD